MSQLDGVSRTGARLRLPVGALALLLVAGACGRDRAPDDSTLTILYPGGDQVLGLPEDDSPKQLVYLPLVTTDEQGNLVGRLLRRAERVPDSTTWIYHLRDDVRWHDGVPFTAHDVAASIEMMRHPSINWLTPGRYTVEVLDDVTLRVEYGPTPTAGLLHEDDWQVYFPKHLIGTLDPERFGEWEIWKRPVGNGPYRFVRSQPGATIELEANPDYYAGRPPIDRVVLRLGEPSMPALLSGEVDFMDIDPVDVTMLREDPRFDVLWTMGDMRIGAVWNHRLPLFADRVIRRALTMAVDRAALYRVLNMPEGVPITDGIYTHRQLRSGEVAPALPYDPAEARRLLASRGWVDRNADGVLDRDGRPFQFSAVVTSEGESSAVFLQAALRAVGVRMELQRLEAGVAIRRMLSGDYEAAVQRVRNQLPGRLGLISMYGEAAFTGYTSEAVQGLLDAMRRSFGHDELRANYHALGEILAADVPVTYLNPIVSYMVHARRVRGLQAYLFPDPFSHITSMRLEPGR